MTSLIAHYETKKTGAHWFSPSTMRFFDSRLETDAYLSDDQRYAYFVTSEQFDEDSTRAYSVRCYDFETQDITTINGFQAYASLEGAKCAAQTFSYEAEPPAE